MFFGPTKFNILFLAAGKLDLLRRMREDFCYKIDYRLRSSLITFSFWYAESGAELGPL